MEGVVEFFCEIVVLWMIWLDCGVFDLYVYCYDIYQCVVEFGFVVDKYFFGVVVNYDDLIEEKLCDVVVVFGY